MQLHDKRFLYICAHADDETLFGATIWKLTRELKVAQFDILLITNGSGGYRFSTLAEHVYNLPALTSEPVARKLLPNIRKQYVFKK